MSENVGFMGLEQLAGGFEQSSNWECLLLGGIRTV